MGFSGGGTGSGASTLIPVGAIMEFGGDGDPSGWLICDGRSLAEAAQPNLFAVIGTRFGDGGGGANFSLPDFQTSNSFAGGATNDAAIGDTGGVDTVTLTGAQSGIAEHTHNFAGFGADQTPLTSGGTNRRSSGSTNLTIATGDTTALSSHENRPPFVKVHFIIKV